MKISLCAALMLAALSTACATKQSAMPGFDDRGRRIVQGEQTPVSVTYRNKPPQYERVVKAANGVQSTSLWSSSPQSLFGDRRANQSGDILTVVIEIDEEAEMKNSIAQDRQSDQGLNINALFGLPELLTKKLPTGASLSPALDLSRQNSINGSGTIKRGEKITLRLAAQVNDVMPNGYLRIEGVQQIVVNHETRYLLVSGIVRKQDISRLNTVTYDKMADARIFYGGKGQVSDMLRSGKGERFLTKALSF